MFNTDEIQDYIHAKTGIRLDKVQTLNEAMIQFRDLAVENDQNMAALMGEMHEQGSDVSAFNGKGAAYSAGGIWNANAISRCIESVHGDKKGLNILDFGAGSGRLLRFMRLFKPSHNYHACDVNKPAMDYVKRVFDNVSTNVINPSPPSEYPDESMDVVYAWSVWSHFDEPTGLAWLEELNRIIKPGGCALVTVHNDTLVERYGTEPMLVQRMKEREGDYSKIRTEYDRNGFAYWHAYPPKAKSVGIDIETFGMAFITRDYIQKNWSQYFEVRDFRMGVPQWQDICVLVKPQS